MPRPVIGLTIKTHFMPSANLGGERIEGCGTNHVYIRGVELAGGVPVLLPNLSGRGMPAALLDGIDGLLLTGGADVNPLLFGEEPIREMGLIDVRRDAFELALTRRALAGTMPVFAVCRGIQVLVLAAGGGIYQDIHRQAKSPLKHLQGTAGRAATHSVNLKPKSRLARIAGKTTVKVNSFHHQAARPEMPKGLVVTGTAPDGVIEAIEGTGRRFILGVQWHPELLLDEEPLSLAMFRAFVNAAKKKKSR